MSTVQNFDLGHNALTGTIPGSLGDLAELKILNIEDNKFSGPIPGSFEDLEERGVIVVTDPGSPIEPTSTKVFSSSFSLISGSGSLSRGSLGQISRRVRQ